MTRKCIVCVRVRVRVRVRARVCARVCVCVCVYIYTIVKCRSIGIYIQSGARLGSHLDKVQKLSNSKSKSSILMSHDIVLRFAPNGMVLAVSSH